MQQVQTYKEAIKNSHNSIRKILGLLLGSLYLEEGNPEKTIQVIMENTDSQKGIIPSLILAGAYKQQRDEEHSQKAVENASYCVKSAILNFKCSGCGTNLDELFDTCPSCYAFDKIQCHPGINS